ncbi:MAG: hypothetical protein KDK53_08370 [Maritimibacter sp.]|nr:hypothetical protein [Maritimibacter sp.]
MRELPDLTSDCVSCAALCCLALHFDKGDNFAIDKPAGLPCPNLDSGLGCTLYNRLEAEGFRGCALYECKGAGQRVVQELFKGKDWLKHPDLAEPMMAAFAAMRQVHDGIELLATAGTLDLPGALEAERQALLRAFTPAEWTLDTLLAFATSGAPVRLKAFLPRLRDWV